MTENDIEVKKSGSSECIKQSRTNINQETKVEKAGYMRQYRAGESSAEGKEKHRVRQIKNACIKITFNFGFPSSMKWCLGPLYVCTW